MSDSCSASDIAFAANCTDPGYQICFDADPDVAGIGVILAFLLSAWATYLFVLITFFFVESFDGTNNELDSRVVTWTKKSRKYIHPFLPHFLAIDRPIDKPFSREAIENIAFTLSDQQLITGISILIVGFARHPVITQYHFYIVYLLGILSYSTHQSTMMIVRERLIKKHWMRSWRLAAIFLIFVFSFAANIPVYNWYFLSELGLATQCVWSSLPSLYLPENIVLLTLTSLFLTWGFLAVVRDIWPEFRTFLETYLAPLARFSYPILRFFSPGVWHYSTRARLAKAREEQGHVHFWWLLDRLTFLIFVLYFTVLQIAGSRIVDLYRVWVTLFYATYAVLGVRRQAKTALTADGTNSLNGNEDIWGFGQILPMLLLALPLSQAYEMIREDMEARKEQAKTKSTPASKASTINSSQGENIPLKDLSSTASSYHAPPRQEADEYYHIRREGTSESVPAEQSAADTNIDIVDALNSHVGPENSDQPDIQSSDEGHPRRVNTVNLERANPQVSSTSCAPSEDGSVVEKKLYDCFLFWLWIWAWILALFGGTTYGAVQGLVF